MLDRLRQRDQGGVHCFSVHDVGHQVFGLVYQSDHRIAFYTSGWLAQEVERLFQPQNMLFGFLKMREYPL
jgi:hypothetical protein